MKFQPGTYYIGDLCYAIQGDSWHSILNKTGHFTSDNQTFKGHQIFAGNTAYGDGTYYDQFGNKYPVDAGLIGIMPLKICDFGVGIKYENEEWVDEREIPNFKFQPGNIFTFDSEFEVGCADGLFKFGHIEIDTNDEDDCEY